jgi:hypothetical protein
MTNLHHCSKSVSGGGRLWKIPWGKVIAFVHELPGAGDSGAQRDEVAWGGMALLIEVEMKMAADRWGPHVSGTK